MARGRFVPYWSARLMGESTETVQSICRAASASARILAWIRSHVPSEANRRCFFQTLCHGPNSAGKVTPGDPAPVPVDDAFNNLTVAPERPAPPPVRTGQQRLDPGPLIITQNRCMRLQAFQTASHRLGDAP